MFSANTSQVSADQVYVEDVFSTYLYTGTPAYAQTIVNGIDLAGKGGLLWIKSRTSDTAPDHYLNFNDGSNIVSNQSNNTSARQVMSPYVAFNSNGFYVNAAPGFLNNNGVNYTSWTFREAPKFFDVVTWTGNGVDNGNGELSRTISHSLGVRPGCIIIKRTDASANWKVTARKSDTTAGVMILNSTSGDQSTDITVLNNGFAGFSSFTATNFGVFSYNGVGDVNASGATYVAYLFAHDTTSDGIIQCGSYTGTSAAGNAQNLGWEPQWLMVKSASGVGDWFMLDNMRGIPTDGNDACLVANSSIAEFTNADRINLTSTGFQFAGSDLNNSGTTYIYIAIRRGPMRTPTSGTSVYNANSVTTASYSVGFAPDMALEKRRAETFNFGNSARLMGSGWLTTNTTNAYNTTASFFWDEKTGNFRQGFDDPGFVWAFRRAPSFFDVVCYTGTGAARTVNHNLGVAPELMIVKIRNGSTYAWLVYSSTSLSGNTVQLNKSDAAFPDNGVFWTTTAPTSTVFSLNDNALNNEAGKNFVSYLFASCPGVSKVGSYTGNGSSQTINCGFAAGARFVLIKRTDSTGDWYVWDTARGIIAANDPHLSLNTTAAEVTTDDSIDPDNSGFIVNQVSATNINVNAATYLYMAVA